MCRNESSYNYKKAVRWIYRIEPSIINCNVKLLDAHLLLRLVEVLLIYSTSAVYVLKKKPLYFDVYMGQFTFIKCKNVNEEGTYIWMSPQFM